MYKIWPEKCVSCLKLKSFLMELIMIIKNNNKENLLSTNKSPSESERIIPMTVVVNIFYFLVDESLLQFLGP